jgi:hypothetical protein
MRWIAGGAGSPTFEYGLTKERTPLNPQIPTRRNEATNLPDLIEYCPQPILRFFGPKIQPKRGMDGWNPTSDAFKSYVLCVLGCVATDR